MGEGKALIVRLRLTGAPAKIMLTLSKILSYILTTPEVLKLGGSVAKLVLSGDKDKAFVGQMLERITNLGRLVGRFVATYELVQADLPESVKMSLAMMYDDVTRELNGMKDLCLSYKDNTGIDPAVVDRAIESARTHLVRIAERDEPETPPDSTM